METLNEALKFIAGKYKNTESNYPELAGLSDVERRKFDVRHCALHSAKLAGKLSLLVKMETMAEILILKKPSN